MVNYLLKNKADPNLHCPGRETPLMAAVRTQKPETAKLLIDYKANVKEWGLLLIFQIVCITWDDYQIFTCPNRLFCLTKRHWGRVSRDKKVPVTIVNATWQVCARIFDPHLLCIMIYVGLAVVYLILIIVDCSLDLASDNAGTDRYNKSKGWRLKVKLYC